MVINFRPLKSDLKKPKPAKLRQGLHVRKSDYVKKESSFGYIGPQTAAERFDLYAGRHYRKNGHIISC
jgi:hypothetical protein